MAGVSKSVYLTVADSKTHQSVFKKVFFNASEYNQYVKTEEFQQKYPKPEFYYIKEIY